MDLLIPQIQPCNPPSLQELKVEEMFHELLCWRVTHFLWMIAWEWRLHMGMMIPNTFMIPCLKKASRSDNVEKASCYLEEHITWRCYKRKRGGSSVLSLQLLEDKQHLGGEDYNIPKLAYS